MHTTVLIPNNVDYSVGNIDFCGSLLIKGDVLGEFRIKAGGSVEVSVTCTMQSSKARAM